MKHIKAEIKTQTPFIKEKRISYPMSGGQIRHLDYKDYVYFLCKGDENHPKSFHWEGRLYRAPTDKVKSWIEGDSHPWFPNNGLLKGPDAFNNYWYNIPVKHPGTKWLKLVHTFPKEVMESFRSLGTSTFSTNDYGMMYKDYTKKADKVVMKKAGDLGEFVLKQYFEKQPGVFNVQLNPQYYGAYDIEFDYEKEAKLSAEEYIMNMVKSYGEDD